MAKQWGQIVDVEHFLFLKELNFKPIANQFVSKPH